ncbi:MAG TPA: AAA family ATPase [Candidatus Saccharimonadales bacterium]|nr:AAA family ATPase [Candidatus Saccharimonadales bacterium]
MAAAAAAVRRYDRLECDWMNPDATELDLHNLRATKARFSRVLSTTSYRILIVTTFICIPPAVLCYLQDLRHLAFGLAAIALGCFIFASWWRDDLYDLPVGGTDLNSRVSRDALLLLPAHGDLSPLTTWEALSKHWQSRFITNRFLISAAVIGEHLSGDPLDMPAVWQNAVMIADSAGSKTIEVGHIAGALLLTSPGMHTLFSQLKLDSKDIDSVVAWLSRGIELMHAGRPNFGGIGRDWAHGFTQLLNRYGHNVSLSVESSGAHFDWLAASDGVKAIKNAFAQGAGAVALIGETGVGKTSHVSALAQLLLQESQDRNLEHRQIISLNPSLIISSAQRPGEIEHIVIQLLTEAMHAGHIMLFMDDAQLFFTSGTGAFDATQIMLPVVQSHAIPMIFAMTPRDYQALKAKNNTFASLLMPVILKDPPEADVMRVLEDTVLGLEHRHKVLITYDALKEAYRLSGRYEQEVAYPGKAILLLEQSLAYASQGVVTATSVQQAIEQTRGVKVTTAAAAESDTLLHLEDKIHERMINQSRAVSVVASSLRRARAGVTNPKRPIGSFLFLGPTGVGKTELAKAISATYFGSEDNMIRLDMSEYQQESDVARLLSDGSSNSNSLIRSVRQQPFSVVLLDEIEKSHPNILNLLLQLLDEGTLTDVGGRAASFKDCVIIATSNAGAGTIRERVERGEQLEAFEKVFIDELITSNQFKPELLNRFDEIVLFRPLNAAELAQVVQLMMSEVNQTLAPQNITVQLTPAAVQKIVEVGYDPRLGARPMRRTLQRAVEDTIAQKILRGEAKPGSSLVLDVPDLSL